MTACMPIGASDMELPDPMLVLYLFQVVWSEGTRGHLGAGHVWVSDPGTTTAFLA